jgi:hypothetical protein
LFFYYGIARKNLKQAAVYQKRHYDLKAKKRLFKKGQPVWTYEPTRKVGIYNKFTNKKQNIIKTMFIKHHIQLLFHINLLGQFFIFNQDSHDLTTG